MNQQSDHLRTINRFHGYVGLLTLSGAFLLCTFAAMFIGQLFGSLFAEQSSGLLAQAAANTLIMFGLPGFLTARFLKRDPARYLGIERPAKGKTSTVFIFFWALMLFLIGMPALNQIIYWNANLPVPDEGIWHTLREMEDSAAAVTASMLSATGIGSLIADILIIGLLTGLCEELFFRGALQKTLINIGLGKHSTIWITALIFSFLHFQFFGFIPRMLLGAYFGYLMYATKSVWVSAFVHAFNNSIVVIFTWLANRGVVLQQVDEFGVTAHGFPATAFASLICFFFLWRAIRSKNVIKL